MRIKILIADDNETNTRILSRRLDERGYDIVVAHNGHDAVRKAIETMPDLILMDLVMPDMNGWDATKAIRENTSTANIPIVAVSANIDDDDKELITDFGFSDYCIKPIKVREFLIKLKSWIHVTDDDVDAMEPLAI